MINPQPIHTDPLLGEVFELLHRMELCQTRSPFQWMASDALRKLQQYEAKISNGHVTQQAFQQQHRIDTSAGN